jgi:RNA polymerase sigma factor (sigma-70 family)
MRPSDAELVAAARDGDRRAFAALAERHYALLLATCRRATSDPEIAADAAQEAVITAMLGLDRLRSGDRFGAWLIGIGLNLSRRALQERARWARLDGAEQPDGRPGPQEAAEAAAIAARVREAIAALPAGQRAAVELFHLADLSHAEVAGELDTRPGAVKTRLHKARRVLRRKLTDLHREEFPMSAPIPMPIADVRRPAGRPEKRIVVLEEIGGRRWLAIWIGIAEADALVGQLEAVELPRPGPYHFAAALLRASGGAVAEVRVSRLVEHTFYATALLADGSEVDARPSDAFGLALVTGAPITVEPAVLESSESFAGLRPQFAAEVSGPHDGASVLAAEVRERLAEKQRELGQLNEPGASPP